MADLKEIKNKVDTSLNESERIEKGYLLTRAIIEIVGKPKEHIKSTLETFIDQIEEKDFYDVEDKQVEEPTETEDEGIFSTFAEITFWTNRMENLAAFCFDFMPSSIEILEPEKMITKAGELTDLFNDLQGRLHHIDMMAKTLHNENKRYAHSMLAISKNIVMLTLSRGPKDVQGLVKTTGIEEKALKPFLDKLIKEKTIEEKDGMYSLRK